MTGTDPDRFPEEKARGLTIDLGFAFTTLPSGVEVGFVDVPGHVRFVKNMLAGVGAVDVALLVVAANEGWMPQSEEHLRILELLGVRHGMVALTKADTVDDEMLELAQLDVAEHLEGSSLDDVPIVVCDSLSGRGLDDVARGARRRARQQRQWRATPAGRASGSTACSRRRARAPSSPARSRAVRSPSTTTCEVADAGSACTRAIDRDGTPAVRTASARGRRSR